MGSRGEGGCVVMVVRRYWERVSLSLSLWERSRVLSSFASSPRAGTSSDGRGTVSEKSHLLLGSFFRSLWERLISLFAVFFFISFTTLPGDQFDIASLPSKCGSFSLRVYTSMLLSDTRWRGAEERGGQHTLLTFCESRLIQARLLPFGIAALRNPVFSSLVYNLPTPLRARILNICRSRTTPLAPAHLKSVLVPAFVPHSGTAPLPHFVRSGF